MKKLAVDGGQPLIVKPFPSWPMWDKTDLAAVEAVIRSGDWERRSGENGARFEREFARFQRSRFAIACANGSVAIELVLEALGIGAGDEVIVPDYTFMATAAAPLRRGAQAVLVDVDPDTFCISPARVEQAISERTKAVIPVHFAGHPCDMEAIGRLAEKHHLAVIEDCAHAHGATWQGRSVGTFGAAGTFSFQGSKTLSCGEGGAVVSNDERLMTICRSLHDAGRVVGESVYRHDLPGTNYRVCELQAALLLAQLARLENQCRRRDANGKLLTELLTGIDGVKPQIRDPRVTCHGHYLFVFLLETDVCPKKFKKALAAEGVPVQLQYPAVHSLGFMKTLNADRGEFPISDRLAERSVWLYHNCLLADPDDVRLIAEAVEKVLAALG